MESSFAQWESGAVGFPSDWKLKRVLSTSSMQTDDIKLGEQNVQTSSSKQIGIQTDFDEPSANEIVQPSTNTPFPPSLFAFFSRVTDPMCKYLEENQDPFASEVFKDFGEDAEETSAEAVKEFTLRNKEISADEFGASCVSWNCKGSQVAVGYSARSHDGWCCHRVPLSVWNLFRSQNFDENVPHAQLYLSSCITVLEFHPSNASVIAVGLYSGEIALVDLYSLDSGFSKRDEESNDDTVGGKDNADPSKLGNLGYVVDGSGHTQKVTGVQWIRLTSNQVEEIVRKNKSPSPYCLISTGKDGCICLWSTNTSNTRLVLEKKFIAWAESVPEDIRLGNRSHLRMKEMGIVGLSSCKDDSFAFIFTSYGGFVFQGNLEGDIEAYTAMAELTNPESLNQETLYDPGIVLITKHEGYPCVIDCSPFHRNIFLSATTSGRVIIQNLLEPLFPMIELFIELKSLGTLNDGRWSGRPSMFAIAHENLVKVYDLKIGKVPALTIPHEQIVTKIAFNKIEVGSLAVCDIQGSTHIWKLPSNLSSHEPDELDILISLIQSTKDEVQRFS